MEFHASVLCRCRAELQTGSPNYCPNSTRSRLTCRHSSRLFSNSGPWARWICMASFTCRLVASPLYTPVTVMTKSDGVRLPLWLSTLCWWNTLSSSFFLTPSRCSIPLVYAFLPVSPMYRYPHSLHFTSYVTPLYLHPLLPPAHTMQFCWSPHSLIYKETIERAKVMVAVAEVPGKSIKSRLQKSDPLRGRECEDPTELHGMCRRG